MDALEEQGRFDYLLRPTFSFLRELRPGPWKSSRFESALASVQLTASAARVREALEREQPDVVIASSPVYGALIDKIYSDGHARDFTFIALVTEPGSETAWAVFAADFYLATHEAAKQRLLSSGVAAEKIRVFGYPVRLGAGTSTSKFEPISEGQPRILYVVNGARRKAPRIWKECSSTLTGRSPP